MKFSLAALSMTSLVAGGASAAQTVEQIHVMYGGALEGNVLQGMSITFSTPSAASALGLAWGYSADALTNTVAIKDSVQYIESSGFHHEAVIESVDCATPSFFYQITADDGKSPVLTTKRAPCDPKKPFNLAVFGDMGYQDSVQRPMKLPLVRDEIEGLVADWSAQFSYDTLLGWKNANQMDAAWHLGDIGYIDDSFAHAPTSFTYEKDYDGYMNWMQNITESVPYLVTPGNHESECHSPSCVVQYFKHGRHLANFTAYNSRWNMPSAQSKGSRGGTNMWYSLDIASAHVVSLNTETDFPGAGEEETGDASIPYLKAGGFAWGSEYMDWLDADLAAATANPDTKWIVIGGHRPFTGTIAKTFQAIFDKYRVHMYFAGHSHSYSRSAPVDGETLQIVAGGAGCEEMGPPKEKVFAQKTWEIEVESDEYSVGMLAISEEKLSWTLVNSKTGDVIDQIDVTE